MWLAGDRPAGGTTTGGPQEERRPGSRRRNDERVHEDPLRDRNASVLSGWIGAPTDRVSQYRYSSRPFHIAIDRPTR